MKNKLLLTTAIASLVTVGGIAQAETKVTGNLEQTYRAISDEAAAGAGSQRGLGAEYNIGLSSSKKLDGGLTASYGFNLENNTGATGADVHFLTIGNDAVSVSIARDNGNNLSASGIPHVSDTASTVVGGAFHNLGINQSDGHNDDHVRADIKGAGGTLTLRYVPSDGAANSHTSSAFADTNSAYDVIYRGSLGVQGLNVVVGQHEVEGTGTNQDAQLRKLSVAYNFGKFAIGAERQTSENSDTSAAQDETTSNVASITFAINDQLSFGFARYETERTDAGAKDPDEEKINMLSMGYSLGGIAFDVNYAMVDNFNNTANDRDVLQIRTIQSF